MIKEGTHKDDKASWLAFMEDFSKANKRNFIDYTQL